MGNLSFWLRQGGDKGDLPFFWKTPGFFIPFLSLSLVSGDWYFVLRIEYKYEIPRKLMECRIEYRWNVVCRICLIPTLFSHSVRTFQTIFPHCVGEPFISANSNINFKSQDTRSQYVYLLKRAGGPKGK